MMSHVLKAGMIAAAVLLSTQTVAWSGNDGPMRHESHRKDFHRPHSVHKPDRHRDRDQVGGNGLPSVVSGLGTFAGSLSALRVRENGLYFASAVDGKDRARETHLAPRARIMSVGAQENAGNGCAYEAGVCVIRGGR
jgi:hypothetical protein